MKSTMPAMPSKPCFRRAPCPAHPRSARARSSRSRRALGYLDFTGNMDTCIAIRMAAKKNGIVTVQAGGGIVADSVPHNEYMESANKAKAVMNAIERASEVDG